MLCLRLRSHHLLLLLLLNLDPLTLLSLLGQGLLEPDPALEPRRVGTSNWLDRRQAAAQGSEPLAVCTTAGAAERGVGTVAAEEAENLGKTPSSRIKEQLIKAKLSRRRQGGAEGESDVGDIHVMSALFLPCLPVGPT